MGRHGYVGPRHGYGQPSESMARIRALGTGTGVGVRDLPSRDNVLASVMATQRDANLMFALCVRSACIGFEVSDWHGNGCDFEVASRSHPRHGYGVRGTGTGVK